MAIKVSDMGYVLRIFDAMEDKPNTRMASLS